MPSTVRAAASSVTPDPLTVLCVGDDGVGLDPIRERLSEDGFEVHTTTPSTAASETPHEIDCVVQRAGTLSTLDVLGALREDDPAVPFVVVAEEIEPALLESLSSRPWTVFLPADADRLSVTLTQWVAQLVDASRIQTVARRVLAAVGTVGDRFAIVAPDGTFGFVTRAYATQFGYATEELLGRSWRTCFPETEAERPLSTAVSAVRDGCQWLGTVPAEDASGDRSRWRVRITGFDDGSLVFWLLEPV